jgi:hypothetical protein
VAPGSSSVEQQNTPVDRLAAIPSSRARQLTFVVVFAVLTLHFASLAIVYLVDPDFAVRQFSRVNRWLGGVRFEPPEVTAWRYATVCGMATLAFMTFLLLMDLGKNFPLLAAAAFFKILNAVLWFWYSATNHGLPVFLAAGIFDLCIVAIMISVARWARPVPLLSRR